MSPVDTGRLPPPDWPVLEERVTIEGDGLPRVCGLRRSALPLAGCAVVDFARRSCTIHLRFENAAVLRHERLHCRGYDHPGEDTFRVAWNLYKARRQA